MKSLYTFVGLMMFLMFTSCNTVRVHSDFDRGADFNQYNSFAFHQGGLNDLQMNDLDKRRIVSAITSQLQAKGMTPSQYETGADLVINISAKNRKNVDVTPWYNPWWGFGPMWGWGGMQQTVREYKTGTIILDFVDRRSNTLVWQGVGEGLNITDLDRKEERIPLAIEEILAKYPPN